MSEITKSGSDFVGYEYKEISAKSEKISMYLDGYLNFGWVPDENMQSVKNNDKVTLHLKRDRKILNKAELTRLERHFEACMEEIEELEHSKTSLATMVSITIGVIGTAFIAGSTFAVTHEPPIIWLCILLAIPGFIGWISPYFVKKEMTWRRTKKVKPLMEQKYNEIYEICEKGNKLIVE